MPAQFLSCDWGTSYFRLRLVSTATNKVLAKSTSSDGVKNLYERSTERSIYRASLFSEIATKHINEISHRHPIVGLPLVISGMASSTIGWKELPYAKVPFALTADGLHIKELNWENPDQVGPTFIVSGAATDSDIMRGEECETIGIMAQPKMQELRNGAKLILPGTHSKHIEIHSGNVTDFKTFMTGELFETLANHTVLRPTVNPKTDVRADFLDYGNRSAFLAGVEAAQTHGLAGALFKVRTRSVLDKVHPNENTAFLSGLVIGSEVESINRKPPNSNQPIVVAANEGLLSLYSLAIGDRENVIFTSEINDATISAHRLILERMYN